MRTAPSGLPRLLAGVSAGGPLSLRQHLDQRGPLPRDAAAGSLIATVERSGLLGRGGAGFPVARKMVAVGTRARRPFVVANGAEGEPASRKDQLLLEAVPHLVLDGAVLAARAVNARAVLIGVKSDAEAAMRSVDVALRQRARADIDDVEMQLIEVSGRYIAGEESALVHALNGGPAKPTFVPPRPFQRGVDGRPTLLLNVETLAHLALIARFGAEWFRELGTAKDPGTQLLTLSGAIATPGVYEAAGGSALGALLDAAGGPSAPLQAVLIGGYAGIWFPWGEASTTLPLGHAALRAVGGSLGPGVVIALPVGACPVVETARVLGYLAEESSGQCGPCVYGLAAIAEAMDEIAAGTVRSSDRGHLERWSFDIAGRGACHHPDGALRLLKSCLRVFAEDIRRHEAGQPCAIEPGLRDLLPVPRLSRIGR